MTKYASFVAALLLLFFTVTAGATLGFAADFYAGKTIRINVGSPPGGGGRRTPGLARAAGKADARVFIKSIGL